MLQNGILHQASLSILLLRVEWLGGRINTSLKLLELYYFKCRCPSISRLLLFPPLVFLLTECLHQSRVFGCTCFVRDVRLHVSKLDSKSLKCNFLGYYRVQKGYRCYCPNFHTYLVSADVAFLENASFSQDPINTSQGGMTICSFILLLCQLPLLCLL